MNLMHLMILIKRKRDRPQINTNQNSQMSTNDSNTEEKSLEFRVEEKVAD